MRTIYHLDTYFEDRVSNFYGIKTRIITNFEMKFLTKNEPK